MTDNIESCESTNENGGVQMINFRSLRPDEVEVRAALCKPNGVSLLLYKNARVDQDILDETLGPLNWQKSYRRDEADPNVLICKISIWDDAKKEWISKEDCGIASNTEKEKGLYSDAQKRAATCVGIGRCLYSAPFIWVSDKKCNIDTQNGRSVLRDSFTVTRMDVENKKIINLELVNDRTGEVVFAWKRKTYSAASTAPEKAVARETVRSANRASDAASYSNKLQEALQFSITTNGERQSIKSFVSRCTDPEQQKKFMIFLEKSSKADTDVAKKFGIVLEALKTGAVRFGS